MNENEMVKRIATLKVEVDLDWFTYDGKDEAEAGWEVLKEIIDTALQEMIRKQRLIPLVKIEFGEWQEDFDG